MVIVVKNDGKSLRLCVNYKGLNDITENQPYPIPRADEMTREASKFKFLTKLDAVSSFWQLSVEPNSRHKTAFITHRGLFEWRALPFGLKGSSFSYQKMADLVLEPHRKYARAYIDDVTVGGHTFEEHLKHLKNVLKAFQEVGIKFKLEKCEFAKPKIQLLGFIVGSGEIQLIESKIKAIRDIAYPTTKRGVRSYLGMCNYFRHFIPHFSQIASPLTDLTKSKSHNRFVLNDDQKESFNKLKDLLTTTPVLVNPDYNRKFVIFCDASDNGVGSVLGQFNEYDLFKPIAIPPRNFLILRGDRV
jgi:hypothetical protein